MKKEQLVHVLSWFAYGLLIFYFQSRIFDIGDALIHTLRLLAIHMMVFYVNLMIFLPKIFEQGKYLYYAVVVIVIIVSVHYLIVYTNDLLPKPDFSGFEGGRGRPRSGLRPFLWLIFGSVVNSILMLFFSTIVWISTENRKRKQREASLINEKLQSEMLFLKTQINPHFLFNALNNVYSLSYNKSPQAPKMIMKLSEMLRYVVYDTSEKKVSLGKEISYIQHYVDFQKLKIGKDIRVDLDIAEVNQEALIEPMLLIPFIENAFKHSNIESIPGSLISIHISTANNTLKMKVLNNLGTEIANGTEKGVGIENVKRRLELAYPETHELNQEIKDGMYHVFLKIDLT
ncbi:MAG: sensor histidine kinase [Cyclobacteriaceae bacterium]